MSAQALKRRSCISYPMTWLFKFQLMQTKTIAEREALYALCGSAQADDACLGVELGGGSTYRGSENKVCFIAAVSLSDEAHPLHVELRPVPFIADKAKYNLSSGCGMLSNGFARFGAVTDADCHQR